MAVAGCILLSLLCRESAYTQDTTCGIIWDPTVLLSDSNDDSYSPKVALSGEDVVHVTWEPGIRPSLPYRRSSDGGTTFASTVDLLVDSITYPWNANWVQMVAEGPRVFVFFNGSTGSDTPVRMVRSTDAGMTWRDPVDISPGIAGEVRPAAISGDTLGIVYSSPTKRILRSTDGGDTWTRTNENLQYDARIALSPGLLHLVQLAVAGTAAEVEYRRSTNLGNTWVQQEFLSTLENRWAYDPAIAAGEVSGMEEVVAAWRDAKYGCLGWVGCSIIARHGANGTGGTTWASEEEVLTSVPRGYSPSLDIRDGKAAAAWVMDHDAPPYIEVSVRGENMRWCPPVDPVSVRTHRATGVGVAVSSGAVHVVWEASQAPDPSTFRIFYRRGRFVETGVGGGGEGIPSAASLGQNYPNPFNPKTTIPYTIDRRTDVTLRVLDLLGREVATLAAGTQEPGSYTKEWDARDVPSGIYFYRLTWSGRVETRKAVLLR
jgi:hypothetical protein